MVPGPFSPRRKKSNGLSDEAEGDGIAVEPSLVRPEARDDHQNQICDGKGHQQNKSNQDNTQDEGTDAVQGEGDLEVEGFLAVCIHQG